MEINFADGKSLVIIFRIWRSRVLLRPVLHGDNDGKLTVSESLYIIGHIAATHRRRHSQYHVIIVELWTAPRIAAHRQAPRCFTNEVCAVESSTMRWPKLSSLIWILRSLGGSFFLFFFLLVFYPPSTRTRKVAVSECTFISARSHGREGLVRQDWTHSTACGQRCDGRAIMGGSLSTSLFVIARAVI